jgi:hypothetical protein
MSEDAAERRGRGVELLGDRPAGLPGDLHQREAVAPLSVEQRRAHVEVVLELLEAVRQERREGLTLRAAVVERPEQRVETAVELLGVESR